MTAPRPRPPSTRLPLLRFVLWGGLGFGLGGLVGAVVMLDLLALIAVRGPLVAAEDQPLVLSLLGCLGYGLMGAVGGAALGLARRQGRAAVRLAVAGLLAFGLGGLCNVLLAGVQGIDLSVVPPAPAQPLLLTVAAFGIRGAMGGALLGLAFRGRHSVRVLSVAGFLGFGLGGGSVSCLFLLPALQPAGQAIGSLGPLPGYALWMGLCTAIGGAVLAAVTAVLPAARETS
jgi:hypothetical protein